MSHEVIAYLAPDEETNDGFQRLVRLEDGSVAIEDVATEAGEDPLDVTQFQQSVPIKDPETKEVIGYEMEPVKRKK